MGQPLQRTKRAVERQPIMHIMSVKDCGPPLRALGFARPRELMPGCSPSAFPRFPPMIRVVVGGRCASGVDRRRWMPAIDSAPRDFPTVITINTDTIKA